MGDSFQISANPFSVDLAAVEFQVAAGLDLSPVGDEAEGAPSEAAAGHRVEGTAPPRPGVPAATGGRRSCPFAPRRSFRRWWKIR